MGKIPPIATVIIGIVLLVGLSVAAFFLLIKPKSEELKAAQEKLATDQAKADTLEKVKSDYEGAVVEWQRARMDLDQLMALRSTHISFYTPIPAWIALWQEYRITMPSVIERFVRSFGLRIVSGVPMPAPPGAPPPAPGNGFMQIPEGGVTLTVEGTMQQLEKFYRSIKYCPRIMTVEGLSLSGTGNLLTATIPMKFYLLVETPPGAAPAATPEAGPGPPGPPGPNPPAGPKPPKDEGGGDDEAAAKPKIGGGGGDGDE